MDTAVILVTRLNGATFALNPDLVERADSTPDTVVTLVDGTKYVISETLAEFMTLVRDYRAAVIAQAQHLDPAPAPVRPPADPTADTTAKIVPLHRRDR